MGRRTATDRLAECIIDMVHEYKKTIESLNSRISILEANVEYWKNNTNKAVEQCDKATDTLGAVADIIAGITEHTEGGHIRLYLSNINTEDGIQLNRLFRLLDIPMTAEQIKEGDTVDED